MRSREGEPGRPRNPRQSHMCDVERESRADNYFSGWEFPRSQPMNWTTTAIAAGALMFTGASAASAQTVIVDDGYATAPVYAAPVVVAPPPVYAAPVGVRPPPVYAPAPVYAAPAPLYAPPPPVYAPPVPAYAAPVVPAVPPPRIAREVVVREPAVRWATYPDW